ncbi:small conductance mechanosensitive channel [Bryocella elongata]|uniref:Small conductance mechanosensitive channel n=1 Tax=Bryocella elongata TaxID=863522 RepID=A0A1H5U487_9BACT|nr:mechanosensitive ion channel family protein [Bryocella elongata]SEF69859.1 small conductance mechanosensitive channel [Bryocella elongata]
MSRLQNISASLNTTTAHVLDSSPAGGTIPKDEHFFKAILEGWHTDLIAFVQNGVPKLVVAFLLAFLAQRVTAFFVRRLQHRADKLVGNSQRAAQLRTMAAIVRATAYGVIGFYLFVEFLAALNVSLGPFIASAGVIGLGISFGAQSIFKDMLTGIFILIEDQYNVGDTIKIASLTGTVEDLSLRITRLRDGDGTLYIVPNSQITTVSNLSRDFAVGTLNVSVDAREDPDRVLRVLQQLATSVRNDVAFKDIVISDPSIPGVDKISGYEVIYPITVRVMVNQRDGVLRELRRRVLKAFADESIAFGSTSSTMILQSPDPKAEAAKAKADAAAEPLPSTPTPGA